MEESLALELEARERAVREREMRLEAMEAVRRVGLDGGEDQVKRLAELVAGESVEETRARAAEAAELIRECARAKAESDMRAVGRVPPRGTGAGVANPYSPSQFNLTEQMRLEKENPELARALKGSV